MYIRASTVDLVYGPTDLCRLSKVKDQFCLRASFVILRVSSHLSSVYMCLRLVVNLYCCAAFPVLLPQSVSVLALDFRPDWIVQLLALDNRPISGISQQ